MKPNNEKTNNQNDKARFFAKPTGNRKPMVGKRPFNKDDLKPSNVSTLCLDRKSVITTTKGGKLRRTFGIFAVIIHHSPLKKQIGVGISGARSFQEVREQAIRNAKKKMITFKMNKNRTLYHDLGASFHGTDVKIFHARVGVKTCPVIRMVFKEIGLNATAKITSGSKNKLTIIRATLAALQKHESISDIADRCGVSYDDVVNRKMCVRNGGENEV